MVACWVILPEDRDDGTSDIRIDDPDQAICTAEEIDYFHLLAVALPDVQVKRSQPVTCVSSSKQRYRFRWDDQPITVFR
jgi:hypothetical protein